jgi:hypothetical protein
MALLRQGDEVAVSPFTGRLSSELGAKIERSADAVRTTHRPRLLLPHIKKGDP